LNGPPENLGAKIPFPPVVVASFLKVSVVPGVTTTLGLLRFKFAVAPTVLPLVVVTALSAVILIGLNTGVETARSALVVSVPPFNLRVDALVPKGAVIVVALSRTEPALMTNPPVIEFSDVIVIKPVPSFVSEHDPPDSVKNVLVPFPIIKTPVPSSVTVIFLFPKIVQVLGLPARENCKFTFAVP
jgi:hypothetical protein